MQPILGRPYINKKNGLVVVFNEAIPIGSNLFKYVTADGLQIPESELNNFQLFSPKQDFDLAASRSKLLTDLSTIEGPNRSDLIIKQNEEERPRLIVEDDSRIEDVNVSEFNTEPESKPVSTKTSTATFTPVENYIQKDISLLEMIKTKKTEINNINFKFDLPDLKFLSVFLENVEDEEDFLEQAKEYYTDLNRDAIDNAIEEYFNNLFKKKDQKKGEIPFVSKEEKSQIEEGI